MWFHTYRVSHIKDHFNMRHPVLAIDINIVDFFFTGLFLPFTFFFFQKEKLFVVTKFIFLDSYIYSYKNNSIWAEELVKKLYERKKDQAKSVIPTMFAMIYSTVKLSNMTEWMLACIKLCFEILQQHKRAKTFQKSYFKLIFHQIRILAWPQVYSWA